MKKKGFTLIELLAVIVILAIIALIAVPVILNIIDKANQSAFKDTAYGIVSAAELYYAEQQLEPNGMTENKEFNLLSQDTEKLQIKGEMPEGKVQITKYGEVALLIKNERYCVTKGYDDSEVVLTEDLEHCYFPHTLVALSKEEVACAMDKTEGACDPGTLFTLKVNNTDTKDFYVMKDEGEKITLIMNENLGDNVAWYADDLNNSYGPTTAINYLDELTDDEWINIPKSEYTYIGIGHDGETRRYTDIVKKMRVRMITYGEASDLNCTTNEETCPSWLYVGTSYWTSTSYATDSDDAWRVVRYGNLGSRDVYANNGTGVRPVIELYK